MKVIGAADVRISVVMLNSGRPDNELKTGF